MAKSAGVTALHGCALALVAGILAVSYPGTLDARITRIEIQGVESPANNGQSSGAAGQYERVFGRAYGS